MSSASESDSPPALARYAPGAGSERYIRFAHDVFDLRLAETQQTILRSLAENQRTLVISGNGVGKSYAVAAGIGAFLFANPNSTVNLTSGTYSILSDTIWKPLKKLHLRAQESGYPIPHRALENPPRLKTEIDSEWFFKAISPTYPKNLEGRHNDRMLSVIEEADSPDITEAHVDSALSTVTSADDRAVLIANPPNERVGIVADLMESDDWHTIQFSSFDSHNVRVDASKLDAPKIPGLVSLEKLIEDYETWNDRDWPGFEQARNDVTDIDARWAKRRLGIIPPRSASVHRPFHADRVQTAYDPTQTIDVSSRIPAGVGLDVARQGGDYNVLTGVYGDALVVLERWQGVDHNAGESIVRDVMDRWPADVPVAVDAQGEGSGLADRLLQAHPGTIRFQAGSKPADKQSFYSLWDEGLFELGQFLSTGHYSDKRLREELLAAARSVRFDEQHYASRDATVLKATSKSTVTDRLGRSPDVLDSAYMAVWASEGKQRTTGKTRLTW